MIIYKQIYYKILDCIKPAPPETGGIIGEVAGKVSRFEYDNGLRNKNIGCYYPDVDKMNKILQLWEIENINFCGIVHSHLKNQVHLSNGDIEYILKIFSYIPDLGRKLYFPIVVDNKLISYEAQMTANGVKIFRKKIEIW